MSLFNGEGTVKANLAAAANETYFRGAIDDQQLADDPLVTGYAYLIFTKLPEWMTKKFPNMKQVLQKQFRGFDGLNDIDLQTATVPLGFSQNEYHVAQQQGPKPPEFTIKFLEMTGSPIASIFQYWSSGIRDPRTNVALYPTRDGVGEYAAKHHTCEFVYIHTRADAGNITGNIIELAVMVTAAIPKRIPLTHFNYQQGTQTTPIEIDIPFSGVVNWSKAIEEYAATLLRRGDTGFTLMPNESFVPVS